MDISFYGTAVRAIGQLVPETFAVDQDMADMFVRRVRLEVGIDCFG